MDKASPLVTIAMPVYNCQRTVARSIRSVLAQTFADWELIIVDDGSTDETLNIVKSFSDPRIRVCSHDRNKGIAPRLNESIGLSRGRYYARMDGDDVCYPQRLERQLTFLGLHPEVDLIGSFMMIFGKNGVPLGKRPRDPRHNTYGGTLLKSIPLAHPTFFGHTEWFRRNRYSEWAKLFEDQELLSRTMESSKFGVIPEILLGYREEELTISKQIRHRKSYLESTKNLRRSSGLARSSLLALIQLSKLCVDVVAIKSGLMYHLLRHRAGPISADERLVWEQVWEMTG